MVILQVKNLTKKFGSFTAVNSISFDLKEGEILGLLGPNGAGKTTTIDMLLGLTKPTTGEIKIFDLRNKLTDSLSSGQLTRLYLCKAFVNNPRLLLLDEPTAFLDPDISDLVRKYILNKVKTEKTSVLFTSHNMAEVTEICDRVNVLL